MMIQVSRKWYYASLLTGGLLLLIAVLTVKDYGMSWDERARFGGGDAKLMYYKNLFAGEWQPAGNDSYPGLFDLPLAYMHAQFPEWGTRSQKGHVWGLAFGFLGLLSAWRLTARLGGERAGFWALAFLATLPRYYGHMFMNPKDVPLAGTYLFGVWALVALFSRLPEVRWRTVCWIGIAAGLAMSTRIAGFLILCYFGFFVGLYLMSKYFTGATAGAASALFKDVRGWFLRGVLAGLIGLLILLVFWPAAHRNPLTQMSTTFGDVRQYGWDAGVLVRGQTWSSADLPADYIPYWLVVTVPEYLQVLLGLGVVLGLYYSMRFRIWRDRSGAGVNFARALLLFSGVFPLLYLLWQQPVLYDGMRHFLFTLPPLVCVAALTFEWLLRRAEAGSRPMLAYLLQGSSVVVALVLVVEMVSLHPYQYLYFNQASGGVPAAYLRDETDYWGLSHQEAAEWLGEYVESIDPAGAQVFTVHLRYSRWMLKEALNSERFELTPEAEGADFFVAITRFGFFDDYPQAELLHVVERQGVPLCFIFALSDELKTKVD